MDKLPNELLLHLLEAAALHSWPNLLALSATSKTFHSLYKTHQRKLLNIALHCTTSPDFKWLPLMVLGNRNKSWGLPDDDFDYNWNHRRIWASDLESYFEAFYDILEKNESPVQGQSPSYDLTTEHGGGARVNEMKRAVQAYHQVRRLLDYCVRKAKEGETAIAVDPRPAWVEKLQTCHDAEGWLHCVYNALLQWSVYRTQEEVEMEPLNLPLHLLDPPFDFFYDLKNATTEQDRILQDWDDDQDMRWDILDSFLAKVLYDLILEHREEVEEVLMEMETYDGTKEELQEPLLPLSVTLEGDDIFAAVISQHILMAHGEDLTPGTAKKETDRDFQYLVYILLKVDDELDKLEWLKKYIRRSFDGHYVQTVRRDHTIDYRLMTDIRHIHEFIR